MDCSLLVYRNKNWFLTVNFISCNFAELINSNRFLWILQTWLNNFTSSSPIWQINPFAFSFFFPLIVRARTSSAMLNSYWQCWEHLCFVPDLREKTFSLSSFIEYDVSCGLCIDATWVIVLRKSPSSNLLSLFTMKFECCFVKCLLFQQLRWSCDSHLRSISWLYYIDWFLYFGLSLHFRNTKMHSKIQKNVPLGHCVESI